LSNDARDHLDAYKDHCEEANISSETEKTNISDQIRMGIKNAKDYKYSIPMQYDKIEK
jgi:hypothetical protein